MTNNATTINYDAASLMLLENREAADATYMFVGAVTVLTNFLLILTVAKSKKLHTSCYFLIANVSVAAIVYAISFFVTALKRIVRLNLHISEVNTRLVCNLELVTCYLGQSACAAAPLATACERLFATLAPIAYKNQGHRSAVFLASMAWVYSIVDSCFTFYGKDLYEIVLNCNLVLTSDVLFEIQSSCAIALSVLVVLLYVWVMLALHREVKLAKMKSESVAEAKVRLEMKVAKSLSVLGCIQLVTQVATRIGLAVLPLIPNINQWTSASYMRMTIFLGLIATFFVFFVLNIEFRQSFVHLFGWMPEKIKKTIKAMRRINASAKVGHFGGIE